jgi:hypothetical protein
MSPTEKPSVGPFSAACFPPCPIDRRRLLAGQAKCALVRAVLIWHEAKLGVSDSSKRGV